MKKLSDVVSEASEIKNVVIDKLNKIPERSDLKKIGTSGMCFSIPVSRLTSSNNWSPRYHSMKCAAREIAEEIKHVHIENLGGKIQSIIENKCTGKGRICPEMASILQDIFDEIK